MIGEFVSTMDIAIQVSLQLLTIGTLDRRAIDFSIEDCTNGDRILNCLLIGMVGKLAERLKALSVEISETDKGGDCIITNSRFQSASFGVGSAIGDWEGTKSSHGKDSKCLMISIRIP
jgi:hypothetical protein